MGAELDRLDVRVESEATKANNQLKKMAGYLNSVAGSLMSINSGGGLNGLASGISRFSRASAELSNVRKTDFNRLVKSVTSLYSLNPQQIYSASSAMSNMARAISSLSGVSAGSTQVAEVAKSISKLGGVGVSRAIANLPQLASAMTSFMTAMANAPVVSRNVIEMTRSLANLASQGSKAGSAAKSVGTAVNNLGDSTQKAAKKTLSLASAFGTLYANYFWAKRAFTALYKAASSSMDFLETVNYFEVTMRNIGEKAVDEWEEAGTKSAEAYASSFSDRAKALTQKMTGYSVDANGNATYTGLKNLGMDPTKVMQYQATFAQVSKSIGVSAESALNFSKALTMLGGDWASLRNISFDQAWEKMASALAGQSRAVRSLGIDITNATLQEYAYKHGIEQKVSEMNQATKAQLRLLAILDQSKVAWGDLANTIESPSNQLRLLQQNAGNCARAFGNLFIPVLQRVLPLMNGLAIAAQRLFTWIGSLLGIKFDSINSSMGGMSDEMSDLVEGADDLEDGISGADAAAKKLKKTLQGWHEINNITTKDDSGSGVSLSGGNEILDAAILDALSEYEQAWNAAFDRMQNKAQWISEKIYKSFEPLRNIIQDFVLGDFGAAGYDTSMLVAGIFNFIADAIDGVDWVAVGQRVGKFIAGIDWVAVFKSVGKVIGSALNASVDFWLGMFSTAPIETFLITLTKIPKILSLMTSGKILSGLTKLASKIGAVVKAVRLELMYRNVTGHFTDISKGIDNIRNNLTGVQKGMIGVIAVSAEFLLLKDGFYDLAKGSDHFVASLAKIAVGAGAAATALYVAFGPVGIVVAAITAVVAAIVGINNAMNDIHAEVVGNAIHNALCYPGGVALSEITAQYAQAIGSITEGFTSITEKSSEMDQAEKNIQAVWMEIEKIETAMEAGVMSVEEGKTELERLFGELATAAQEKLGIVVDTLFAAFGENGAMRTAYERVGLETEGILESVLQFQSQYEQRMSELSALMASTEPGTPEYAQYREEYAKLTASLDDVTKAVTNYDLVLSQIHINYEDLFDAEGNVDQEKLNEVLKTITDAVKNADKDLEDAVSAINNSFNELYTKALVMGDTESAEYYKSQMDALPQALDLLKSDVATKAMELTDIIQADLLYKTKEVLDNASEEFDNAGWLYKALNYKDTDMRDALKKYNIGLLTISGEIEKSFNELGVSGAGWAAAAADKMSDSLIIKYDAKTQRLNMDEYREIIDTEMGKISESMKGHGRDAVAGYCEGLKDQQGIAFVGGYAEDLANIVAEAIAEAQDSHSPSKVTEALGKDAVEGYGLGIEENTGGTLEIVKYYIEVILNAFSALPGSMMEIGKEASQGLIDGIESLEGALYNKINEIVKNITNSLNGAFEINGAPTGISLGNIPTYSTGGYPEDGLFMANHGELVGRFANGQTAVANNDQIAEGIEEAAYRGMSRALSERKDTTNVNIQVEGDPNGIFKVVQKESKDYERRNGRPAFG